MVKINWNSNNHYPARLYFEDLTVNESFKIVGCHAVYVKVSRKNLSNYTEYFMCELATGRLFGSTKSPCERVNVVVNIDSDNYVPKT